MFGGKREGCERKSVQVWFKGISRDRTTPGVPYSTETIFRAQTDALPDVVFSRNKIGQAFANERQTGKRCNIDDCGLQHDTNQNL